MTESMQPTPETLTRLQRLRASVLAFQNKIASLPAKETDTGLNEQFNRLRREAKELLPDEQFDKKAPRAVTNEVLANRFQKVVMPRLLGVIIIGVVLALLGLGVNSIILEDIIVNTAGCLISSAGMLLVIGAAAVFTANQAQSRLSNYGDLYQHCEALLAQIDHILTLAIPDWADRSEVEKLPAIPSLAALTLDSLHKQAEVWQEKLTTLEAQHLALEEDAPPALPVAIDFAQRELNRVNQEIAALRAEAAASPAAGETGPLPAPAAVSSTGPAGDAVDVQTPPPDETPPLQPSLSNETAEKPAPGPDNNDNSNEENREKARANTLGMPLSKPDEEAADKA